MYSESSTRILLIGDNEPYSEALKSLLNHHSDLLVVDSLTADSNVAPIIERDRPHLVILESYTPHGANIDLGKSILEHFPSLKLVLVTFYQNSGLMDVARRAGFRSYVSRDINPNEVLLGIRTVLSGQTYFNLDAMRTCNYTGDEFTLRLSLTVQEIELIELTLKGLSMMQIAFHFLVDLESVQMYRRSIYMKLGIKNDADLIQFAVRHGL